MIMVARRRSTRNSAAANKKAEIVMTAPSTPVAVAVAVAKRGRARPKCNTKKASAAATANKCAPTVTAAFSSSKHSRSLFRVPLGDISANNDNCGSLVEEHPSKKKSTKAEAGGHSGVFMKAAPATGKGAAVAAKKKNSATVTSSPAKVTPAKKTRKRSTSTGGGSNTKQSKKRGIPSPSTFEILRDSDESDNNDGDEFGRESVKKAGASVFELQITIADDHPHAIHYGNIAGMARRPTVQYEFEEELGGDDDWRRSGAIDY